MPRPTPISPNTSEHYRMFHHGWAFCEECGRKTEKHNLTNYMCESCADIKHKDHRILVHIGLVNLNRQRELPLQHLPT